MTLPSAGPLSIGDIQTEFGGSNPAALSEYYAGGVNVPTGTEGDGGPIPSSGTIAISDFYGAAAIVPADLDMTAGALAGFRGLGATYGSVSPSAFNGGTLVAFNSSGTAITINFTGASGLSSFFTQVTITGGGPTLVGVNADTFIPGGGGDDVWIFLDTFEFVDTTVYTLGFS